MTVQHETEVAIKDVTHEAVIAASWTVRVGSDGPDVRVTSDELSPTQSGRMKRNRATHVRRMLAAVTFIVPDC